MADDHVVPLLESDPERDPPYRVNEAAVGQEFVLWSNGNGFGNRNCGETSWHGLVDNDLEAADSSDPAHSSQWWGVDTGSRVGHLPRLLTGSNACGWSEDSIDESAEGCQLAVPLCTETEGNGTNTRMRCDRIATFEITYVGNGTDPESCIATNKKTVCARMIAGSVAVEGRGSTDPVDDNEVSLIRLVQ